MPWFDVAGVGNVIMGAGLRPIAKAVELPPDPTAGAPALDPTCEGEAEWLSYSTITFHLTLYGLRR